MIVNLIQTGEQSGSLENACNQASVLAREQFRMRTEWTMRVLMGILFGVVVLFVAYTIVSMYAGVIGSATAMADG